MLEVLNMNFTGMLHKPGRAILLVETRIKKHLEALRMAQLYASRNTGGIFYA